MGVLLGKIIPVMLVFFLGFILKQLRVFSKEDGSALLKVFFYVAIPALTLLSVTQMKFSYELLWLPVVAGLVVIANYFVARCCGKLFRLETRSLGAFLVGTLIMNTGFMFPFLLALKGEEGLAQGALFDLGNVALMFTFVYWLACRHGESSDNKSLMLGKLLTSPPLIALVVGLIMNLNHVQLPEGATHFLRTLGYMSIPLIMLTLGIYFTPTPYKIVPVCSAVFIRVAMGLFLGFLFVLLFDLKGSMKAVVLICSSAPTGVMSLAFCSMEKLDSEFAAGVVSYSLITSLTIVPFLLQALA